ncbi:MAG TPA: hypothetical protein VFB08_02175 [Burkholderiales bacterium]|nr:hypothetical protein [Burkholderiales bacterium]
MNEIQRPAAGGTAGPGLDQQQGRADGSATSRGAQPRKWQRVLRAFVDGATLNRFDAWRELRDSCLNTTVSQIERRGITILRAEETVPGAYGSEVHCMRYRLAPESLQRARELLGSPTLADAPSVAGNALAQAGLGIQTLGSPTERKGVVPTTLPADRTPEAGDSSDSPGGEP